MGKEAAARRPSTASRARTKPAGNDSRARKSAATREAILAAALDEFSSQGFAAARLDDVARRARVAKGTIYVHFRDKEALFQELIRSVLSPFVGTVEVALHRNLPVRAIAAEVVELFVREIYGTRRKDVIRLIITEGARFPKLAEFYHREVLSRVMAAFRGLMRRAVARGEIKGDALVRFPQLIGAPAILAIVWNGLFERFEPIEVRALMHAHLDLLFGKERAP